METKKWKWFKLGDKRLFDIKKGSRLTKADMVKGNIHYIGAIDSNNGVSEHIANDEKIHPANTITVSYNGSVAEAFYQNKEYWATDDVNVLYPLFNLNPYIALFLTTIIRKEKYRYNYGRKWKKEIMVGSKIKLPVNVMGNPDWEYIESYVKLNILPKLPARARSIWNNEFNTEPLYKQKISLKDRKWQWFVFGILIDEPYKAIPYSAYTLTECNHEEPRAIKYITRTDANNGCAAFVLEEDFANIEEGNAITIGDTTSTIYYQSTPFICGDHIIVIRAPWLNKHTGLFITTLLNKERFRYNYGRAYLKDSVMSTKIKLPIDADGNPDWQFMEDYIKSLPYSANI